MESQIVTFKRAVLSCVAVSVLCLQGSNVGINEIFFFFSFQTKTIVGVKRSGVFTCYRSSFMEKYLTVKKHQIYASKNTLCT